MPSPISTTAPPRPKAVTQRQIAQSLNVSQSLVALALNGHPTISAATRAKVEKAARELGYERYANGAARAMAAQRYGNRAKTGQIAVLMGDVMDGMALQDMPFFREILQGIHDTATKSGLDVAIHILRPGNLPRVVSSESIDGAICIYSRTISSDLIQAGVTLPVVRLASYEPEFWAIYPDDTAGTLATTRHLVALGHKKMAYIGSAVRSHHDALRQHRERGFRQAMDEANLTVDEDHVIHGLAAPSFSAGRDAMLNLLQRTRDFTAVVCAHDTVALGAIEAMQSVGLRVPEDVSVTGFDGTASRNPISGYGSSSTLTTAFFDRRIMGRRAVEMLDEIALAPDQPPRQEVLPTRLMVRQSSAAPCAANQ